MGRLDGGAAKLRRAITQDREQGRGMEREGETPYLSVILVISKETAMA
jgi:hypothetical protein